MFSLIMIAFCGVVVGFGLRRWRALQNVNHTITLTICLISVASMLGSAIGGWALYRYVFKESKKEGTE